jgi:prephenate dehydrogenase
MKDSSAPWRPRGAAFEVMVLGCGLIGGSLARATRKRWSGARISIADRPPILRAARRRRIAQAVISPREVFARLESAPPDLLVLALPVDVIARVVPRVAEAARRSEHPPLVLDVGSVKAPIVDLAQQHRCPRFVGGHPMAGKEQGGIEASSVSLFVDRPFVLCPSADTSTSDLSKARRWVAGLGARPLVLDAAEHDRVVALTSHIPHLAAWTLMDVAMRQQTDLSRKGLIWDLAAGSWRDATRVAAADPGLWASILQHNAPAITSVLDEWIETLQRVRDGVASGSDVLQDGEQGVDAIAIARQRRKIRAKLPPIRRR